MIESFRTHPSHGPFASKQPACLSSERPKSWLRLNAGRRGRSERGAAIQEQSQTRTAARQYVAPSGTKRF